MTDCIDAMKKGFPYETNKTLKAQNDKLFSVDANSTRLDKEKSDVFHVFAMYSIFLCKRGQPCVEFGVGFLSTQTNILIQQDWNNQCNYQVLFL